MQTGQVHGETVHPTPHYPATLVQDTASCTLAVQLFGRPKCNPSLRYLLLKQNILHYQLLLREGISVINLIKDLKGKGFSIPVPNPKIQCRTFEDNKSCIKIATNHKTRARTKHLSVKLYHFRSYVVNKTISIEHLSTTD